MVFRCGICGFFFLWLSTSRSQVVKDIKWQFLFIQNDEVFTKTKSLLLNTLFWLRCQFLLKFRPVCWHSLGGSQKRSKNLLTLYMDGPLWRTHTHYWLHTCLEERFGFFPKPPNNIYVRHINPWKKCSNLMQFLKYLAEPFSRSLRSPRSNDLKTKNDKNSKWKLVKTRWNPKFGLSDLENDPLTSMTSEEAG